MENSKIDTLTPQQATRIVENGGLVVSKNGMRFYRIDEGITYHNGPKAGALKRLNDDYLPHPDYPPAVFDRGYPLTLPGPEAKALLMAAPGGMLWGAIPPVNEVPFEELAEWFDDGAFQSQSPHRYSWRDWEIIEIRIRPNWLSSQRERFAQGRFGDRQETKEPTMPTPTPIIYLPNTAPITFPWKGTGAECVRIWNAAPAGMLEWSDGSCSKWITDRDVLGFASHNYHLRLRSDAPKPGDVVGAQRAWELVHAGWVVTEGDAASTAWALVNGVVQDTKDLEPYGFLDSHFADGSYTLLRHEPWRTSSLATGYVWDGKQAAAALRAGMEAKQVHWADDDLVRSVGEKIVNTRGCVCWEKYPHEEYLKSYTANNWALRWPAKETNMEEKVQPLNATQAWEELNSISLIYGDKSYYEKFYWATQGIIAGLHAHIVRPAEDTLTAGQALDALIAGECEFVGKNKVLWTPDDIDGHEDIMLNTFIESAPFTRVPAAPTSKTVTLESDMEVTVYADRVEADVPWCGKWTSTKRKYEVALKLEGYIGEKVENFAEKQGHCSQVSLSHGYIRTVGIEVSNRTITFADIRRVLSAMQEVEG